MEKPKELDKKTDEKLGRMVKKVLSYRVKEKAAPKKKEQERK